MHLFFKLSAVKSPIIFLVEIFWGSDFLSLPLYFLQKRNKEQSVNVRQTDLLSESYRYTYNNYFFKTREGTINFYLMVLFMEPFNAIVSLSHYIQTHQYVYKLISTIFMPIILWKIFLKKLVFYKANKTFPNALMHPV